MALGARGSAQGHNPTATQEVAKASEADVILQLDIKLTSLFHVRVAPQTPLMTKLGLLRQCDVISFALQSALATTLQRWGARGGEEHGS